MDQPIRRPLVVAIAVAATAIAALTGCGGAKSTETSTSHSVDPTNKGAKPGGANNFSPTAVAPSHPPSAPARAVPIPTPDHGEFPTGCPQSLDSVQKTVPVSPS